MKKGYAKGKFVGKNSFAYKGREVTASCVVCSKSFLSHLSSKRKFCGRSCYYSFRKIESSVNCLNCGVMFIQRKKNGKPNKDKKFCTKSCSSSYNKKIKPTRYWLGRARPDMRGRNNPMWKEVKKTDESKTIRRLVEYRLWRESVYKRDNWTCTECNQRGGELHPHHIKPFAFFPELRFAIDNGVTLCVPCHRKTDSYGGKSINYKKKLLTKT
jgi:5-methylcytosine-specific restriction endonuclease McrA